MEEKTFIILKPDAIQDIDIKNYIFHSIEKEGLIIENSKKFVLFRKDIFSIWPHCVVDSVCAYLLERYIGNTELEMYELKGENSLIKVHEIKKNVRKKYSKSFYSNCLHAPKNRREYEEQTSILAGSEDEEHLNLTYPVVEKTFERYGKVTASEQRDCGISLWNFIQIVEFDQIFTYCLLNAIEKDMYCVMLENDDIHDFSFIVGGLYEYFQTWSIAEAYYHVMGVEQKDQFPILLTRDTSETETLMNYLRAYSINSRVYAPSELREMLPLSKAGDC